MDEINNSIPEEKTGFANKKIIIMAIIAALAMTGAYVIWNNYQTAPAPEKPAGGVAVKANNMNMETLQAGQGPEAKAGDLVTVHYTGTLTDGTKFDSSLDRGTPFSFTLGAGQVIKGWDMGVAGMKAGEKRKLTIPADMAYGDRAIGSIPANSTLVFEVEMIKIGQ